VPINPRLTCAARNPCPHGAVAVSLACPSWRSGPGVPQKANPEAGAVSPPSVFSEHMLLRGAQRRSCRRNPSLRHDRVQCFNIASVPWSERIRRSPSFATSQESRTCPRTNACGCYRARHGLDRALPMDCRGRSEEPPEALLQRAICLLHCVYVQPCDTLSETSV